MGWPCSGLLFPASCLILGWLAGSGSIEVLHEPTCFSDYIEISTCEWQLDSPVNCSAELRLSYRLDFDFFENIMCVPENSAGAACVCAMQINNVVSVDTYQLDLWAGRRLLWHGSFKPSDHVKPKAPENLTVVADAYDTWLLTWSNPYPSKHYLHEKLTYLVNVSQEDDPAEFKIYNVTYLDSTLRLPASTLKYGVSYEARVKTWAQRYNSSWSEWSPSTTWYNYYQVPLEQHLPLGVSISCLVILAICLSCYFTIIKIKKEWWDQIPNPARSPLVAIVIQDSQVSLWEKRSRGQERTKCPRWKTCLAKLLPCLLDHDMKKDEESPKAARNGPFQGPEKAAWRPVEVSKMVLWPENISVVRCVELLEAPVEREEEVEEEDKGNWCASPESSGSGFQEGREGIAARLTEGLFLDLLGTKDGDFGQPGLGDSCLFPPSSLGPEGAASQGKEQPFHPESPPPASPACAELPMVISDNPAYRCFSSVQSQAPSPGELDPDPQLAEGPGEGGPCAPQPSEPPTVLQPEPETWEQMLRQSVLQHGAAAASASAPTSGYREFVQALEQGGTQDGEVAGSSSSGGAGYKAFSSLLTNGAVCMGMEGLGAGSGDGGYKPFQNLVSGHLAPVPTPLFTFGLDMEPPPGPQNSFLPGDSLGHLGLEPAVKAEDRQKPLQPPGPASEAPEDDDLGSGIVYSALTCHLCGHLKQCHSQGKDSQAPVAASPCCGCRCGDRPSPPGSPADPALGELPQEARLAPASLAPWGIADEAKSLLSLQPVTSSAQNSSQMPKAAGLVSPAPPHVRVS